MVKQFSDYIAIPNFPEDSRAALSHAIDLAKASQKFILPEDGRLYDDPEYRALDESETLSLPYPFIALEYTRKRNDGQQQEGTKSTKSIVLARERDDYIVITPIMWMNHLGLWGPMPDVALPRVGYLDRATVFGGRTAVRIKCSDPRLPTSDYDDEVGALLCFLNVLQCKNVHVERSEPRKTGKKIKAALPFDSYHILTIDSPSGSGKAGQSGSHRSPREHLRRGHIRRLGDGRRVWVNATVVGAGRGSGVITKDYALMAA